MGIEKSHYFINPLGVLESVHINDMASLPWAGKCKGPH